MTHALVRLADGDRTAFETVYREAQPRVHALVRRMCPNDPDVDDVAQHALLKVFERASDYDADIGPALPWILGIAAWTVRSQDAAATS